MMIAGKAMILKWATTSCSMYLNSIGGAQLNQIDPNVMTRTATQKLGTAARSMPKLLTP